MFLLELLDCDPDWNGPLVGFAHTKAGCPVVVPCCFVATSDLPIILEITLVGYADDFNL